MIVDNQQGWAFRTWLLFLLGGLAGIVVHWLGDSMAGVPADSLRLALATFIGTGVTVFGFTLERREWASTVAFSLLAALVVS